MKTNRLRDLREDKDLSQKAIAEMFFIQVTQYRRYELGESDLPLEWAKKFARFYNVSLDYIAGLTNIPRALDPEIEPTQPHYNKDLEFAKRIKKTYEEIYKGEHHDM